MSDHDEEPELIAQLSAIILDDLNERMGHFAELARTSGVDAHSFDLVASGAVVQLFALVVGTALYHPDLTAGELAGELRRFPYDSAARYAVELLSAAMRDRGKH